MMMTLQTLFAEATRLSREIDRIARQTKYNDYGDLSEMDIDTKDEEQIFLMNELDSVMDKLADAKAKIEYLNRPIEETSRLYRNGYGQYETASGFCYHSGYSIEALIEDEYRNAAYWVKTRVEHNGADYYLVGHRDISLDGLTVRIRKCS